MLKFNVDRIVPFPLWGDLKRYNLHYFRSDAVSALSVALLALPQAIAMAFVADLPISAGIFSAIFGALFAAAFGSSPYLIAGPTNSVAILLQSGIAEILHTSYGGVSGSERDALALQILMLIVLVAGLFQILGALLRMGRLAQLASRSVVLGYVSGLAFAIVVTQLFAFLGLSLPEGSSPLYQKGWVLLKNLHQFDPVTTVIGVGCLMLLLFSGRFSKKIPMAVITFIVAGAVAFLLRYFSFGEEIALLDSVGTIKLGLPKLSLPLGQMHIVGKVVPLAFAISLISVLEGTTVGRFYARSSYSDNQQVYGLGISNWFTAFLGGMPVSGSFSRSALNRLTGAKTRLSAVFSSLFLFVIVFFFGFLLAKVPLAALSALMLYTVCSMVNFKDVLVCLRATRTDSIIVLVTFFSSIVFALDVALYVGVILSIILYLRQATVPDLVEYTFTQIGKLRPMNREDKRLDPQICIVHAEGPLFFGAVDLLQIKLRQLVHKKGIKIVILQIINTRHIDASVCLILQRVYAHFRKKGRYLLISGVTPEVREVMRKAGVIDTMGKKYIFAANERVPSAPTRDAYTFAKQLL